MSEENNNEQQESTPVDETATEEQQEAQTSQEVIEADWEEVKEIVSVRAALSQTENELSRFLLQVEKQKERYLSRINQLESGLYQLGSELKSSKGIDEELTYELKLPSQSGEKAYFIRKQQ